MDRSCCFLRWSRVVRTRARRLGVRPVHPSVFLLVVRLSRTSQASLYRSRARVTRDACGLAARMLAPQVVRVRKSQAVMLGLSRQGSCV